MHKHLKLISACVGGAMALGLGAVTAHAATIGACLITKTDTNPFFVKMKKGAEAEAKELGIDLKTYAGKDDGDNETQVAAIETCIADGAKGILITASDTKAIVPTVEKARKAGILVIALDTPLDPIDCRRHDLRHRQLPGRRADRRMGQGHDWATRRQDAKIAFLDLAVSQPTVGVLRDQGFMKGFGIDIKDPNKWGDETDPRIVGHDVTAGNEEGGRKAMENLLQKDPSINLVYTINEPAAAGAYQALKAVGLEKGDDRLDRRRLPGREERQGRRDRRHLAAISAADGFRRASRRSRNSPRTAPSRRTARASTSSTPA